MKNIKIILNDNKTFTAENIDEVKILEDEHNATVIEVHFPEDYASYSKRVDFLNIRNEKWTTSLYAPEDENNRYDETFNKSVFRFTIPSAMAKRGELQIQFIAYLVDGSNTIVPFQVILATINKSIIYAVKEGRENPDLLIQAYEYSNKALEIAREALDKTANAERAALEAEKSAKNAENSAKSAENSAKSAQTSANSANTRAINAESSARSAQESAEYAEEVSNTANTKSDNAVKVSNEANTKSTNAVNTANLANENSEEALEISNQANTKSTNAVNTSNSANTKADNAVATSNDALEIAQEAKDIAGTANTKSDNAVDIATESNTKADNAVSTAIGANTKADQAVATSNTANTKSDQAVVTSNNANTKSDTALSVAQSANEKSTQTIETSNNAISTAEEALNQVVSKMGTKVFIGTNENPEANLNFESDPQTQINNNHNYSQETRNITSTNASNISGNANSIETNKNDIQKLINNNTKIQNSQGGFACGVGSTEEPGMNFRGYTLCDNSGKVPVARLLDAIYPVGSVYLSVNNINPANLFGGSWEALPEGYALWTTTTEGQGAGTIGAGLPNITGGFTIKNTDIPNSVIIGQDGAFQRWGTGSNARVVYDRSSTKGTEYVYFAASNSNGIYGASSTVQPPAIKLYVWKRIG